MRLADLVGRLHAAFDPAAAMADVAALCQHDRYQASAGIVAAAEYVAERAAAAGLVDVEVLRFPADGSQQWWSFRGPLSWTPLRAALYLGDRAVLRYPEQPFVLAAYSAPTPPGGLVARLLTWPAVLAGADPAGALVAVSGESGAAARELARRGALGLAADPLAGRPERLPDQVGRLELPPGSPLVGFSVGPKLLAELVAAAGDGRTARVEVELGPPAVMPVVTAGTPGDAAKAELLLTAHLCHPRPSANDNASGVAALLGLARVLGSGGPLAPPPEAPALRFVWGPEFVGLAAYLATCGTRPAAGVNIDLAGEDQRRCGGPLVIERAPDELPSYLPAVAERCAALLPAAARSYSGAVDCDTWAWRSTPHVGASDHGLLAAAPVSCPAVGLGHWPDRFNHTSADTLDMVDPGELRRTATIGGATVAALAGAIGGDAELAADLAAATVAWAITHVTRGLPGAAPREVPTPAVPGIPAPPTVPAAGAVPPPPLAGQRAAPVSSTQVLASSGLPELPAPLPAGCSGAGADLLDPWSAEAAGRRAQHRLEVALGAVRALTNLDTSPKPLADISADLHIALSTIAALATRARTGSARQHAGDSVGEATRGLAGRVLVPACDGPLNLRALSAASTASDQAWLADRLAEDRGGGYARMLALARALDGQRTTREAAWWAALASELPIPVRFADTFFDVLCRAGWARSASAAAEQEGGT